METFGFVGSNSLTGKKSSKDLSLVTSQETDQAVDSSTDVNLVQNSENHNGTRTAPDLEKTADSGQSKDNTQPAAPPSLSGSRQGSSRGAARLTSEEKVKIIKRTAAHHMATMGYTGHKQTSQACVIL